MHRKNLVLASLIFFSIVNVWAGGRKENESREADDPVGFSEIIDTSEKKPGKYNFYLEAQDKGGNTALAGPHNIFLDPESDKPVVNIANPREKMSVKGNLNIVGTCVDDDAVSYVELWFNDDESTLVRAEGADFWSYYYDTSGLQDGLYSISVRGVDINGLAGNAKKVSWHLDRKRPETRVTSHPLGALVSGKITLKGTVNDGNGVDALSYSLDGGKRYVAVPIKFDKKANIYSFEIQVNTKAMDDGPLVIWFRARDKQGTRGAASHLLFVDNTGPDIKIVYPEPNEKVNGIFTVAGYATDTIGLKSLTWKLGKETGEFPLVIGNPWWVKEFDIRGQKLSKLDLEIRAVDLSGNVSVAKRKLSVDQAADLPRVSLESPVANASFQGNTIIMAGLATDNDAVASILYAIDGQLPFEVPCFGNFRLAIPNIPDGVHTLEVWAKDITGLEGPKVQVKGIVVLGSAPELRIQAVRTGQGKAALTGDFYTGMDIDPRAGAVLDLRINSAATLSSISWRFGNLVPTEAPLKNAKAGEYRHEVAIPSDISYGLVRLEVQVQDLHGQQGVLEEYFYLADPESGRPAARDFQWVRAQSNADGRILVLQAGEPLLGLFAGRSLHSASLAGAGAENFSVRLDGMGRVTLYAQREGEYGPLSLDLVDSSGETCQAGPFRFLVDFEDPSLSLTGGMDGKWVQDSVRVQFSVSDANRIAAAEYSVDLGASWLPLLSGGELAAIKGSAAFEKSLAVSSVPDGALTLMLRLSDDAKRQAISYFTVLKDTTPPEPVFIVPISDARVNGTILLGMAVKEAGKVASVMYERPAAVIDGVSYPALSKAVYTADDTDPDFRPLTFLSVFTETQEMPLAPNMRFIFTDEAGNSAALDSMPFTIDNEMDIPVVQINLPLENEVVTTDFVVSGITYDDDAVKYIYWNIDDAQPQQLEASHGYSIPIALSSLTDNEHTVSIVAEDIYGVKSKPETRTFRVSLEEPRAALVLPSYDQIVKETVKLSGTASDANGIDKVQVSLDNGNTFNDAVGTTNWTYEFNSAVVKDGTHVVFIRVFDKYDISAMYSSLINIDNTAPEVVLDSPADGMVTTGTVCITGRAIDNIYMKNIAIEVRSLEGHGVPPAIASRSVAPSSILMETLDLSSLRDGLYNIEVWAIDKADNVTRVSRNVQLAKDSQPNYVDILYPLNGEYVQGNFNLYGITGGVDKAQSVSISINDRSGPGPEEVSEAGYYRFALGAEDLEEGLNRIRVWSDFGGTGLVTSVERVINYQSAGAWVTIDSLNMGDFAFERPWLSGRAGYDLSEADHEILADKNAVKDRKDEVKAKTLKSVELSFDNGHTFISAGKGREKDSDWRYRLETGDMAEGMHYLIVRANMANGETALSRTLVQVDKTPPAIRLIAPMAGGVYNTSLEYTALASDNVSLKGMSYHLRVGDKAAYEIPGFIQGLYFESSIPPFIKQMAKGAPWILTGGATYMDVGMGLSFFDDNVKLQAQYGFMTQGLYESMGVFEPLRYGGNVFGIKLLANIYTLPFASFAGPDWEWLFASFALGANFSLFSVSQSGSPTWLSAMLVQLEFPKVTIPKRKSLRTFSFFTEGELWFVPTDVDATANNINVVVPHIITGLRLYIF